MKFNARNHIVGKVYDLTQENMSAMLAEVERLELRCANLRDWLTTISNTRVEAYAYDGSHHRALADAALESDAEIPQPQSIGSCSRCGSCVGAGQSVCFGCHAEVQR